MEYKLLILWLGPLFICLIWCYLIYKSPTIARWTEVDKESQLFTGILVSLIPVVNVVFVLAVVIVVVFNLFSEYELERFFKCFKRKWLNKDHLG